MKVQHRGIVMSQNGMVCSAHPLSSWVGADVLNKGGNAMDAAIAMALATGVVLPDMCGLGGDAFMLWYDSKTNKVTAINGSGPAPLKASRDYYVSKGYKSVPKYGINSVTVPGAVGVYFKSLSLFGTKEFHELSHYAIQYAEKGVPVSQRVQRHMGTDLDRLREYPSAAKMYLNNGTPYKIGDIIANKDYAESLKYLNTYGVDGFYKGDIAKKIVQYSKEHDGLFEMEDFENYSPVVCDPISINYRGYKVYQTPPVSQGVILLEELNILEGYDLQSLGEDSADVIHLMVEAKKIAFHDRARYFGDPDFVQNPLKVILSKNYAEDVRKNLSTTKTNRNVVDIIPYDADGDTTSMVVVDKWGNAVSFIHSVSATWGSTVIVDGTGILLNNRAGTGFNLIDGHPNCIAPGKKTMHTLNTWLITKDNKLKWVGNTPGGDNQPQWNMQMIVNLIDFNMNVQEAVEAPKWVDVQDISPIEESIGNSVLKIESRVSADTIAELSKKGHNVTLFEPFGASGASQVIEVRENGVLFGGSDPRADGAAVGV